MNNIWVFSFKSKSNDLNLDNCYGYCAYEVLHGIFFKQTKAFEVGPYTFAFFATFNHITFCKATAAFG